MFLKFPAVGGNRSGCGSLRLAQESRRLKGRAEKMHNDHGVRKLINRRMVVFTAMILAVMISAGKPALAQDVYDIDPGLSRIEGSIKYTVVGRYKALFEKFDGKLYFDPEKKQLTGVDLWIENNSLRSSFESLDKIVLSPQLLHAEEYPQTVFKSKSIVPSGKPNEYDVTGALTLHGVTEDITFPFIVEGPFTDHQNTHILAKGVWVIARKDFNIYWSRFLDKGGILVGNHMTVDWEINAFKE